MKGKIILALGIILLLLGCVQNNPSNPSPSSGGNNSGVVTVQMNGVSFVPSQITVTQGTTLRFVNADGFAHDLEITGVVTKQVVQGGESVDVVMSQKGTFNLVCERHLGAGMEGTITVN